MLYLVWNLVSLLVGIFLSLLLVSIIILYVTYFMKELKKAVKQ